MASIAYPTSASIRGPWIIDAESLLHLDRVVDSCLTRMTEQRTQDLESAYVSEQTRLIEDGYDGARQETTMKSLRPMIQRRFAEKRNQVTVYLSGGRTAEGRGFEELMNQPHMQDELPRGFAITAEAGLSRISVELSVDKPWDSDLKMSVNSNDQQFALELFGKLQNWATDIQPKRWVKRWANAGAIPKLLSGLFCGFLLALLFVTLTPRPGPSEVKQEARQLAQHGVNSDNQLVALQLLLDLESGYEPQPTPSRHLIPGTQFWIYTAFVATIILILNFPPQGAIGLWAGKDKVNKQQRWCQFVSITIPGFILTFFLLPWLKHLLHTP